MKLIHYSDIFSYNSKIKKQFDFFPELMGVETFPEAFSKVVNMTKDNDRRLIYKIKTALNGNHTLVIELDKPNLTIDDIAHFIVNIIKNNGFVKIDSPALETRFPDIPELTEADGTLKIDPQDFNELIYDWQDIIEEQVNEKTLLDKNSYEYIFNHYHSLTPEEKALYIIENKALLEQEIPLFLINSNTPLPGCKELIIDFIDNNKISAETFSKIELYLKTRANTEDNLKEISIEILEHIEKTIPKIFLRDSKFFLRYHNKITTSYILPDNIINNDVLTILAKKSLIDRMVPNVLSENWLKDLNNIKQIKKVDEENNTFLMQVTNREDIFNHYAQQEKSVFIDYMNTVETSYIYQLILNKKTELLKNPDIFKKCFLIKTKETKNALSKQDFYLEFSKFLSNENPFDYLKNSSTHITTTNDALMVSYFSEYLEEFDKSIIKKWLPYIIEKDTLLTNSINLNIIDIENNKEEIITQLALSFNQLYSEKMILKLEKECTITRKDFLKVAPNLYKFDFFENERKDKEITINYIKSCYSRNQFVEIDKISPEFLFDINICLELINEKNDYSNVFPKGHFQNLNFIIPLLNKIQDYPIDNKHKYINKLPQKLKHFLSSCPNGVAQGNYLQSFLMKKIIDKNILPENIPEETTTRSFKL